MDPVASWLEVKRDDTSEVNRTFSALFVFAAEHRPKLVDAVGDRMLDVYMSINPAWNNPRTALTRTTLKHEVGTGWVG